MRWSPTLACLMLCGCGWQAAGSPAPSVVVPAPLSVHIGQTAIVALPAAPAGETRTASTSAASIATVHIDAQGNLDVVGIAPGTTTVNEKDLSGTVVIIERSYTVIVAR